MHGMGLAHCDVKLANVLLDINTKKHQLVVVVSDFGISRVVTNEKLKVEAFEISTLR